ncbi:MAG: ECF-type sigma factor [Planctomycetaceae bacterium]
MSADETITHWIVRLKQGDQAAAEQLWNRYFQRLVGLARVRLRGAISRAADEEDVALSAFHSMCRGAERGHFPKLQDRGSLWPLLVVLTVRKACNLIAYERREKRGGGRVLSEADIQADADGAAALDRFLNEDPGPDVLAMLNEQCRMLLEQLDTEQRAIALAKLEGRTNREIAAERDCGLRTVERRIELIRKIWQQHIDTAEE